MCGMPPVHQDGLRASSQELVIVSQAVLGTVIFCREKFGIGLLIRIGSAPTTPPFPPVVQRCAPRRPGGKPHESWRVSAPGLLALRVYHRLPWSFFGATPRCAARGGVPTPAGSDSITARLGPGTYWRRGQNEEDKVLYVETDRL